MPNSRHSNGHGKGEDTKLLSIPGLTARLEKFADLTTGKTKIYYTHSPNLDSEDLALKLTSKLFVEYSPHTRILVVAQKSPSKRHGVVFLVNSADEIVRYNDSVDPIAYLADIEVDGTIRYRVEQAEPLSVEEHIIDDVQKTVAELEKCAVVKGSDSKNR